MGIALGELGRERLVESQVKDVTMIFQPSLCRSPSLERERRPRIRDTPRVRRQLSLRRPSATPCVSVTAILLPQSNAVSTTRTGLCPWGGCVQYLAVEDDGGRRAYVPDVGGAGLPRVSAQVDHSCRRRGACPPIGVIRGGGGGRGEKAALDRPATPK